MMNDFELKDTESVPDGIKRIIGGQIDHALYNIEHNIDSDFDESIHESRKSSKRVRAVLRLVKDEIGTKLYKRDNYLFRDINRYLAEIRNISVIIESLGKVVKDCPGNDYSELINETIRFKDKLIEILFAEENRHKTVADLLNTGKERAMKLPLKKDDIKVLFSGMSKIYSLCDTCMQNARKEPTNENLHEWRKQVKYLYYQFQVLTPFIPDELVVHKPNLDKIAEHLGEDHDLAELEIFLDNISGIYPDDYGINTLEETIEKSRNDLQSRVFLLAVDIFNKNTEKLINNLLSNQQI
jgi:CHAD domain-containing protein